MPQQPPTMVTPGVQHDAHGLAVLLGVHVKDGDAVLDAREPGVCLHHDGHFAHGSMRSTSGTRSSGPSEQLIPTASAPIELKVTAATSGVVPRKVRPSSANVIVTKAGRSEFSTTARSAALASARSAMVSMMKRSAPAAVAARAWRAKQLVGVVEGERPHGLEELPRRADVRGDVAGPRPAGTGHGGIEDLLHRRRRAELVLVSAKGVGGDHVCAGGHIGGVNLRHLFGVSEAEKLGQLAGGKAALLELRTHGAVEHEEVLSVEDALQIVVGHAQAPRLQAGLGPGTVELLCVCHAHPPTLSFRSVCYRR